MKNIKEEELREKTIELLNNDDDLFIEMVDELDNYNGFADGFRGYPMYELDDLFCGCSVLDFLGKITDDFCKDDDYFVDTIYGIESTSDLAEHYHDNVDTDDLIDNLIDEYYSINIYDSDLDELIEQLADLDEEIA